MMRSSFKTFAMALVCSALFAVKAAASDESLKVAGSAGVEMAESPELVVRQPRSFGYFIGDTLTQSILLETQGQAFDLREWPNAQRVGVWFERRPARTEINPEDGRHWLVLEHQIVNAPREPASIELPALRLEDTSGREWIVPRWTIHVAPLTTESADLQQVADLLRPSREPPHIATRLIERRLFVYGVGAALLAACWLAWVVWRNWRARKEQPFARAWEELRGLRDGTPEAWQALHRAFDRTAGRVIQSASISTLIQAAPHLAAHRARIEQFYSQSSELFFGRGLPANALSVHELCRELRQLERRYER